jgi:CheY-like chemotaxis protein
MMRGKRVLVVEDNFLLSELLADVMRSYGAFVEGPVGYAAEAIDLIQTKGLDGVLLDLQLHAGSGLEVARALRLRGIPFIVVTGYSQETLPTELAAAPYASKPVHMDELIQLARDTFGGRGSGARLNFAVVERQVIDSIDVRLSM